METFENVGCGCVFFRELTQIDSVAVFQNEPEVAEEDGPQGGGVGMFLQFVPHLGEQLCDPSPSAGSIFRVSVAK